MGTRTKGAEAAPTKERGKGWRWKTAGALSLALAMGMISVPAIAQDERQAGVGDDGVRLSDSDASGTLAGGRRLTLVTPLSDPGASQAGFTLPCLGLGAAEESLGACLSRGGGLDRVPASMGFGLRYGLDGWLRLGAGVDFQAFGSTDEPQSGLTWSAGGTMGSGAASGLHGQRLSGTLSAMVDVRALTGLDLAGVRPFLGAGLSVGGVQTERSPDGLALSGFPSDDTAASGMSWGATLGSNVAVGKGITLDFAYRYAGQESTGALDPGPGGRSAFRNAPVAGDGGNTANHGMSIGLHLSF